MWLIELVFPQFCKSYIRSTDISEYFRESLAIRDNESFTVYAVELPWLEQRWYNGYILDMGSLSHWGLITAPGQEANGDNRDAFFKINVC